MYKKENVMAGIVTYNPDIDRLGECISAVIEQVNTIIIVDNGSDNVDAIQRIIPDSIILKRWKKNKGIAHALKIIMRYAMKQKFSWVLTVDQDSVVQRGLVNEYLKYANREIYDNVALFTCLIQDRNFKDRKHEKQGAVIEKVKECITSGAFCNVEKYKKIDGYDTSFFIDCVDFDLCYQFRDIGYDVCRIRYLGLLHEAGHGENRMFLFWPIVVYHQDVERIYTLARNGIYLWKKHPNIFGLPIMLKKQMALFARIVLYEDGKLPKLKAFIHGLNHGIVEGKYVNSM